MTIADEQGDITEMLEAELAKERRSNNIRMAVGGGVALIVAGYFGWTYGRISELIEPESLAQVVAGVAVEQIPKASETLKASIVDGAPGVAEGASTALIDMIPTYRESLERELTPIIDDAAETLAEAWMARMIVAMERAEKYPERHPEKIAMAHAADALAERVTGVLDTAMDEPMDGGATPRQRIQASLKHLKKIDGALKKIAQNKGDPKEREFLIAWMSMMDRYSGPAIGAADEGKTKKTVVAAKGKGNKAKGKKKIIGPLSQRAPDADAAAAARP